MAYEPINQKAFERWIKALREFAKQPSYLHLRFPLMLETTKGEAYSPFGILCKLHAEDTGGKFDFNNEDPKKLRNNLTYLGAISMPPKVVEDWLNVGPSFLSSLFNYNDPKGGFNNVADALEKLLKEVK